MTAKQLRQQVDEQRQPDHDFIAWREPDQERERVELLDFFLRTTLEKIPEVAEFSLLTLEQLWERLFALQGENLSRHWRKKVEVMDWQVTDSLGRRRVRSCSFRPEGVLAVYEEILAMEGFEQQS